MAENIIIISHHLGGIGGVQQFVRTISAQFLADGHRVTVVGMSTPKGVDYSVNNNEVLLYNKDIFTTRPDLLFTDALVTKRSSKEVQKIIDQNSNPIVIITNPLVYLFFKDINTSKVKKVIAQMHSSADFLLQGRGLSKAYKFLVERYYMRPDLILMLTQEDAQVVGTYFKWEHVSYIYNPLPITKTKPKCSPLENKQVVFAGRLTEIKQIEQAISIFAAVSDQNPGWRFDIYGDGELKKKLEKQISALKMEQSIVLHGHYEGIQKVYETASLMMLTSRKEGLPMAVIEAMNYGIPVIAYNCSPGVEFLVKDKGALVDLNNQKAFEVTLSNYMQNVLLRKKSGENSICFIKQFQASSIANIWYNYFNKS
ncbi:MAG: glycosyltransferase [Culicoidibacterales bacterium]